jgi:hypothetical protein
MDRVSTFSILSPQRAGRPLSTLPRVGEIVQTLDKEVRTAEGENKLENKVSRTTKKI